VRGSSRSVEFEHVDWGSLKQLLPYFSEYLGRIALALLCLVGAKLASVGLPFILKHIVDQINTEGSSAVAQEPVLLVPLALLLAYGFVRFANVVFGELRDTLFGRVTERAMRRIGHRVFQHLHSLDLAYHLNRRTGGVSRDIERGGAAFYGIQYRANVYRNRHDYCSAAVELSLLVCGNSVCLGTGVCRLFGDCNRTENGLYSRNEPSRV